MRTIWPDCIDPSDFGHLEKTRYGLDQTWARAEQLVSNSVEFGKYLGKVSAKTSVSQLREGKKKKKNSWSASSKPVRKYQEGTLIPVMQTVPTSAAPHLSSKKQYGDKTEANCQSTMVAGAIFLGRIPGYFAGPVHKRGPQAPSVNGEVQQGPIHGSYRWCPVGWISDSSRHPRNEETGAALKGLHPNAGNCWNGSLA